MVGAPLPRQKAAVPRALGYLFKEKKQKLIYRMRGETPIFPRSEWDRHQMTIPPFRPPTHAWPF